MIDYQKAETTVANFPGAIKAINVTFQHSYACGADYGTKQIQFSGKHKAYGFKTKVAVGPDGQAHYVSIPYPGLVHNMKIFCNHIDKHLERLEKGPGNDREIDNLTIEGVDKAKMWAALMDRGYQGASKLGRFLTPKKKTAFCDLDSTNKKKNRRIEEDRVLVENYFGRTKLLWGMAKQTFQLKDDLYDPTMAICFALTNYHVSLLPLCNKDVMVEDNYNRRLIDAYNRATKETQN